jgi:hypothetical protein
VFRVADPLGVNKRLVTKIQSGKVTVADLQAGGAVVLGTASDNYAPCADSGQHNCGNIYAVSIRLSEVGLPPSAYITWFQAQQACKNARKRLPTNTEWQAAVAGTPDPGGDNDTTDCNTGGPEVAVATGSRSACVSSDGAFDMVGNLYEWVGDWVPRSTLPCGSWSAGVSPTDDHQCLVGASTSGEPGALLRGGVFGSGAGAGPLAVLDGEPSLSSNYLGFRCAR